jgi:tRNA(fMet)-specific endonuclease VapC
LGRLEVSSTHLLDTNILVAYQNGEEEIAARIEAEFVVTSSILLGELYFGAYKSGRTEMNLERVEKTRSRISVFDCDEETARFFGRVKSLLREKGRPIPENDIWIAAVALQQDLVLVTRDAHFGAVD